MSEARLQGAGLIKTSALEGVFLRHSPTVWAALSVMAVLVLLAAFNGKDRVDSITATIESVQTSESQLVTSLTGAVERYEANPTGDPPSVMSPGAAGLSILTRTAAKTPGPFDALATGLSDVKPNAYPVTAHAAYTFLNRTEIDNPLNLQTGGFDLAFVIVFVAPVFIIALTFDLLSGEKERGTLGLVLSHGVSVPRVVLAKVLTRAGVILGSLVALNIVAFLVVGVDFGDPVQLVQALLWLGGVVLYGAFWFALGLLINAFNLPSVSNGIVLANAWLVFVVVLPALTNLAAVTVYPPPSRVELTTELREAAKEVEEESAEAREEYYFDHPELAGDNANPDAFFFQVIASETAIAAAIAPTLAAFEDQAKAQEDLVDTLSFLSPAILTQRALTAVAGTDRSAYQAFRDQVIAFHETWQSFFTVKILTSRPLSSADYAALPEFTYEPADGAAISRATTGALLGLFILTVLAVIWATFKFRRYPPV